MLLKNKEDINNYAEANQSLKYASIKPSIDTATSEFLIPVLGIDQYQDLDTAWNQATPALTTAQESLLVKAQKALAYYSLYEFTPFAEVQIGDGGLRTNRTDAKPGAFRYQAENIQNALLSRAHKYLEEMLEHLENNIADYPLWSASDEFANYRALFITTGKQFKTAYPNVQHPRQLYLKLLPSFLLIEELTIQPTIGATFFTALKTKAALTAPVWSAPEKQFLAYLHQAIAYLAVAEGVPQLNVQISNQGISVIAPGTEGNTTSNRKKNAPESQLSLLMRKSAEMGQRWLSRAVIYLNEHTDDFPDYDPLHNQPEAEEETDSSTIYTNNSTFSM